MTTMEKLTILTDAAKYDAACTSSGLHRQARRGQMGSTTVAVNPPSPKVTCTASPGATSFQLFKIVPSALRAMAYPRPSTLSGLMASRDAARAANR